MTDAAPLLIDVKQVGKLLGISPATVRRLADSGRMPRPLALGRARRWSRQELEAWLAAGCPRVVPLPRRKTTP